MRAKEYYKNWQDQQHRECDPIKNAFVAAGNMVVEMEMIGKARHAKSDQSFLAIFKEQQRKWEAFCRLLIADVGKTVADRLSREGFESSMKSLMPEVYEMLCGALATQLGKQPNQRR